MPCMHVCMCVCVYMCVCARVCARVWVWTQCVLYYISYILCLLPRVDEEGRVPNHTYTNGEHYWESNVTLT